MRVLPSGLNALIMSRILELLRRDKQGAFTCVTPPLARLGRRISGALPLNPRHFPLWANDMAECGITSVGGCLGAPRETMHSTHPADATDAVRPDHASGYPDRTSRRHGYARVAMPCPMVGMCRVPWLRLRSHASSKGRNVPTPAQLWDGPQSSLDSRTTGARGGRHGSACLLSCGWPKAKNVGGLGAALPGTVSESAPRAALPTVFPPPAIRPRAHGRCVRVRVWR